MDPKPTVIDILEALVARTVKQGTVLECLGIRFEVISQEPYKFAVTYTDGETDTFTARQLAAK